MYYYLSLGSNIDPERSAVQMLRHLCQNFGCVALYPFRYTQPEGIDAATPFVNGLLVIRLDASWPYLQGASKAMMRKRSVSSEQALESQRRLVKARLNAIEEAMGRDRNDPERSLKDRSADIDILASSESLDMAPFSLRSEAYVLQCFQLRGPAPNLEVFGLASHQRPASVHLDAISGEIVVIEDELDRFQYGLESTLASD